MTLKKVLVFFLCALQLFVCGCDAGTTGTTSIDSDNSITADESVNDGRLDTVYGKQFEVSIDGKLGVELVYDAEYTQAEECFTKEYFLNLAEDTVALYKKYDFITMSFPENSSVIVGEAIVSYNPIGIKDAAFHYGVPTRTVDENRVINGNKMTLYKNSTENYKVLASEICYLRAVFASDFCKNATSFETYNFSGFYGFGQEIIFKDKDGKKTGLEFNTHGQISLSVEGQKESILIITNEMLGVDA